MPWIYYPHRPELGFRFVPESTPTGGQSEVRSTHGTRISPSPRVERRSAGDVRYFLGLDLGQTSDFTALAVLRQLLPPQDGSSSLPSPPRHPSPACRYELIGLQRFPLGTPYTAIVRCIADLLARDPLRKPPATLLVDATGVGMPVVEMFRGAGMKPIAVILTAGAAATRVDSHRWHVPKRDLASSLQILLQSGRLKIAARLPEAATLRQELLTLRVRVTPAANDTYTAWREGDHDDTVLAVALAAWAGEMPVRRQLRIY